MKIPSRLALFILLAVFTTPIYGEFVFLNDGGIIEGKIVRDEPRSIIIIDNTNKKRTIPHNTIKRILYTKISMNKIYVQKRDGKGFAAYLVDEDRDNYTFRYDLYKPAEFTVDRKDVLFMSEKNPSGLKAAAVTTDSVSLTWIPPYDEVRKYIVYMKKGEKEKYVPVENTGSPSITVKSLKSNTMYYFIVTSIDNGSNESSPSNEVAVVTRNIRPDKPKVTSVRRSGDADRIVAWNESMDRDGTVGKYRIYGTADAKRDKIVEQASREYLLKDVMRFDKVELVAVDDRDEESDSARIRVEGLDDFITLRAGLFMPIGKFAHMADPGYGGTLSYTKVDMFTDNVELGVEAGYYRISGGGSMEEYSHVTDKAFFAPFQLNAAYRMRLGKRLSFTPFVSSGVWYFHMEYRERNEDTLVISKKKFTDIGPVAGAGIAAWLQLGDSFMLTARLHGGYLVGSKTGMYAGCDFGVIYGL